MTVCMCLPPQAASSRLSFCEKLVLDHKADWNCLMHSSAQPCCQCLFLTVVVNIDLCQIHCHQKSCCFVRQEKIDFWDSVYGFNMSSIKQRALIEPLVDSVDPDQIATNSCQMKAIDILEMKVQDADFQVMLHPEPWPVGLPFHAFIHFSSHAECTLFSDGYTQLGCW